MLESAAGIRLSAPWKTALSHSEHIFAREQEEKPADKTAVSGA
jgi:hypothetical protein